jgi:hypothetical protein
MERYSHTSLRAKPLPESETKIKSRITRMGAKEVV